MRFQHADGAQEFFAHEVIFDTSILADNMVQLAGNATAINAPGIFEDSGIHKRKPDQYASNGIPGC